MLARQPVTAPTRAGATVPTGSPVRPAPGVGLDALPALVAGTPLAVRAVLRQHGHRFVELVTP